MKRKIIKINEEKCIGCGLCAAACHEGAIGMVDGKAKLLREDYCDGLGDCLPACPVDAISFEEREAPAYNEAAVLAAKREKEAARNPEAQSKLDNWPIQIKLAPLTAPVYQGTNLLIAADCTAFSYGNFHHDFMKNRVTLIGCTKLDQVDYAEKLTQIISNNNIASITVVKMEVPCCTGMEVAVKRALNATGKWIPLQTITINIDGTIKK